MSRKKTSITIFADDKEISSSLQNALANVQTADVKSEDVSISNMNGNVVKIASHSDIVIFTTNPENAEDISAIRTMDRSRGENTILLALTDSSISLARARALSDAGVDEVLPYPMSDEELSGQVDKWIKKTQIASISPGDKEGVIIPVFQARGGVGSTTVAVNLADHLLAKKSRFRSEPGNKVALVDLDLQFGSIGDFLDLSSQDAILQMAKEGIVPDAGWIEKAMVETDSGLKVFTASEDFMPLDAVNDKQIEALIEGLRRSYDYVVIDLPRALVPWVQPIMNVADELILVIDTTVPCVRTAKRLIDFFKGENPALRVEAVINHEKRPFVQSQAHKEAAKLLDLKFEHWLPDDPKAARAMVDYGKPLSEVAARSDLNKAIASLAKSTMKALPSVEHQATR